MFGVRALHNVCVSVVSILMITACQLAPTRVNESSQRTEDKSVILDVRSPFDYGLNRIEGSLHFPWQNLAENSQSGELLRDPRQAGLRLSLLGLDPSKPVIVVGDGPLKGSGEEGRLAWNLLYLGFKNVQVAAIDQFKDLLTQMPTPAPTNGDLWVPELQKNLVLSQKEFLSLPKATRVIDVRSRKEFSVRRALPGVEVINLEWSRFYNVQGKPNSEIQRTLNEWGIHPNEPIIVISNRGVRSAAAAYALLTLGYSNVRNFVGGYQSISAANL